MFAKSDIRPDDIVQEVLGTAGMGHNNPRQKIQYHLRLKQELEEMRHECMLLLRERFHLEQCVRYLAVRSQLPVPGKALPSPQGGADSRSPLEKNPLQPASLRRHHLYATPVSRRSLMLAGRGKQALQEGQAWQSKVGAAAPLLLCMWSGCNTLTAAHGCQACLAESQVVQQLESRMFFCNQIVLL